MDNHRLSLNNHRRNVTKTQRIIFIEMNFYSLSFLYDAYNEILEHM